MADALKGLGDALRRLTEVISLRDDPTNNAAPLTSDEYKKISAAKAAQRNAKLYDFRDKALDIDFDNSQDTVARRTYTTRLFTYIHAEFNFNSPRYLSRFARVTHLVFTPLYVEKTLRQRPEAMSIRSRLQKAFSWLGSSLASGSNAPDAAKIIGNRTQETLDWLWREAIHNSATEHDSPNFRGGKDKIFEFVQELFDYSEPFITTKRSVWEMKKKLMIGLGVNHPAAKATQRVEDEIRDAGLSNRLTNTVEFFWRFSKQEKAHFKWTRHARPYQTYTLTHEDTTGIPDGEDPFSKTALQAFPEDIFKDLFGRYIQGANYTIIPLDAFLNLPGVTLSNLEMATKREVTERIARAFNPYRTEGDGRIQDSIVISRTRQFIHRCFKEPRDGEFEHEFVGFKCMDGQAYVFSSIRNDYPSVSGEIDTFQNLFTRTVIIDCGMNGFQRARLVQNLTEFATERTLALLWIARFRLLHNALNVIQARLSLAVSNYHNGDEQKGSVVLEEYYDDLATHGSKAKPERQRQLIIALEFLSSCLTILNDVIEGGITDRSSGTAGAYATIEGKIRSIREQPILGHQTLTDFLQRRFVPAARMIGRTGERYIRLRERINEIADLSNAHLQAEQRDEHRDEAKQQTWLLRVAEYFGEVALGYYGADLVWNFLSSACGANDASLGNMAMHVCTRGATGLEPFISKAFVYTIFVGLVLFLVTTSAIRMGTHFWKDRRGGGRA